MRRLTATLLLITPALALAHGFAQRYDLPVPLHLYLLGAGFTVALSFVVIGVFARRHHAVTDYPRFDLLSTPVRLLSHPVVTGLLRGAVLLFLAAVIVAGFIGDQNPYRNLAPTSIWVIWWVGLAYVCGLAGNLWALINPWNTAFRWAERLAGRPLSLGLGWPRWLGCWPATVLFLGFVWAELVWPESDHPARLACAALGYSLVTWAGMALFGRHAWLRSGEAFSLVFGYLARFSCTELRVLGVRRCQHCASHACPPPIGDCVDCLECFESAPAGERQLNLRPWAVGLLTREPLSVSATVFVLLMLASVTFDGLLATPLWASTAEWMLYSETVRPALIALQDLAGNAIAALSTIALGGFLLAFVLLYALFSALVRACTPRAARGSLGVREVAGLFVLSLVPIALAYHLAHYLSFLLIVGQYMIPLASDPLGHGWNLFGTRLYRVDIGIVGARFVWISSVIAIVAGHIVAVWLGHVMALRAFGTRRAALLSQVPMLLLMVAYTVLSLWILAQPVVETG
ncbi:MAG: hypothetical protein R3233_06685 [Xanthomonadales bacterium]|nr:hypothetical protein [Xanthomonadales bacterium]